MQRESDELQRKSMSTLLIQQGVLRYGFVLTLTLASAITDKALRLTLRGILGPFQNTLSIIMICRFHLELQKRNECPNGTKASPSHSTLSTFRAATERIHQSVMDDFGDLEFNESLGAEASNQNVELQYFHSSSEILIKIILGIAVD
ncbi:hypothetical protein K439DRAFT_981295 [Ramaria rubella]|nr:hypothetical protein K439DRAFT_981295 [Ramaria rubella]